MKTIDVIVGARPNFMKVAALFAIASEFTSLKLRLIHTGQHYDEAMSGVFLKELGLPKPACNLGVGSGSHATQTAQVMIGYEQWVSENRPDVCLVVGDVNSTIACALVAAKMQIVVAHEEAGLRSFDRTMPEELNRIVTDSLSDLLFVNEPSGVKNLMKEGVASSKVHLVGNVMIDTLLSQVEDAKKQGKYVEFGLESRQYTFVTFHRPSKEIMGSANLILEFPDAKFVMETSQNAPYEKRALLGFYQKPRLSILGVQLGVVFKLIPSIIKKKLGIIDDIDIVIDAAGFSYSDQWGAC